ncbi:MAG: metallophosphoesterase [Planctomycetales bacterium]|nr:metallophosphoesterase [Planctomycetales bacterium]
MSARGLFISDLHLLSRRSVGQRHWDLLRRDLHAYDVLLLGGDIFDFRWSLHGPLDSSVTVARDWLLQAVDENPSLRLIYLLGNHDCLTLWQSMLQTVAIECPRFCWSEHPLAIGHNVFLHGDILDAGTSHFHLDRYRSQFSEDHRERSDLAHRIYDAVVAFRMHQLPGHMLHYPRRVTRRLGAYLRSLNLAAEQGIHEVYFGHTHRPLSGVPFQGQLYFNSGSGVRHLPFRPCRFQCDVELDEVVEKLTMSPKSLLRAP